MCSGAAHSLRQGTCLMPHASSWVNLAESECCSNSVFIVEEQGGDSTWEEEVQFNKGRRVCLVHSSLFQLKAWHTVGTQMLAELRKDWKDREVLLLKLSLKRWAVDMGMLYPEALAVRIWPPCSEFVGNYRLLWALWSWCWHVKGSDLSGDWNFSKFPLGSRFSGFIVWQACGPNHIWISLRSMKPQVVMDSEYPRNPQMPWSLVLEGVRMLSHLF